MRNLKKILALVLALVMSLSLMATAGATQFTDDASIKTEYKTAAEVLDNLGVFVGYDDGTFKPNATLTRAQAAVLFYRIATGDVESKYIENYTYMASNKFNDLTGYDWAKGYINYCQNAGIVVGTSTTTFAPGRPVTGYQLLIMMLRTLGYDKNGEFSGTGWELTSASKARALGMLDNITDGDLGATKTAGASREMTAEILFRGLLSKTVKYSITTPGLYAEDADTLGKQNLGLEYFEGVIIANEHANLDSDSVLPANNTRFETDEGKIVTLTNQATDLDQVGQRYTVYIADEERALTTLEDAGNVVKANEKDGKGGQPMTVKAVADGLDCTDAEYFINYDEDRYSEASSEWLIRYAVTEGSLAGDAYKAWREYLSDGVKNNGKKFESRDIVNGDGNKVPEYVVSISPYSAITAEDLGIMQEIFYTANRLWRDDWDNTNRTDRYGYLDGEVYAGTSSLEDLSDIMSWRQFEDKYLESGLLTAYEGVKRGNSLRVIDNDGDGKAEYVFRIDWTQDKVSSIYKEQAIFTSGLKLDAGDYKAGDVYNWTEIDGIRIIHPATIVNGTVTKKDFKNVTVTINDTVYDQSDIDNETDLDDNIMQMSDKENYNAYLDEYENIRTYELAEGTKYALLTEFYADNNQNWNSVTNQKFWAEVTIGDEPTTEYLAPSNSIFRSAYVWTDRVDGLNVTLSGHYNYLQPAVAHLNFATSWGKTYNGVVLDENSITPNSVWYRDVFQMRAVNPLPINILTPNPDPITDWMNFYGVFAYAPTGNNTITTGRYGPVRAGVDDPTQIYYNTTDGFSFTNVARYNSLTEDSINLETASRRYVKNGENYFYGYDVNGKFVKKTAAEWAKYNSDPVNAGKLPAPGTPAVLHVPSYVVPTTAEEVIRYADAGNGYFYVYDVDYVQLDTTKLGLVSNSWNGTNFRHFPINDKYSTFYNTISNNYVDALTTTEFFIVYGDVYNNGARHGYVEHYVGYDAVDWNKLINNNQIRAAYAVAQNTSADAADVDYWTADVIVIEVTGQAQPDSISLMYYNPFESTGNVQYLNSLNNQWFNLKAADPDITINPINGTRGNYAWSNSSWNSSMYGFYGLFHEDAYDAAADELRVAQSVSITSDFNNRGIYAGMIDRDARILATSEYIDIDFIGLDNPGYGTPVDIRWTDKDAGEQVVPFYKLVNNGKYTEAVELVVSGELRVDDIQPGDLLILVYDHGNVTRRTDVPAYIVDLGSRDKLSAAYASINSILSIDTSKTPAWLVDLFVDIAVEQGADTRDINDIAKDLLAKAYAFYNKAVADITSVTAAEVRGLVVEIEAILDNTGLTVANRNDLVSVRAQLVNLYDANFLADDKKAAIKAAEAMITDADLEIEDVQSAYDELVRVINACSSYLDLTEIYDLDDGIFAVKWDSDKNGYVYASGYVTDLEDAIEEFVKDQKTPDTTLPTPDAKGVVTLKKNVELDKTPTLTGVTEINLNGHDITFANGFTGIPASQTSGKNYSMDAILVSDKLEITGKGTIALDSEDGDSHVIGVIGSAELVIGKDVILSSAVVADDDGDNTSAGIAVHSTADGAKITVNGTIEGMVGMTFHKDSADCTVNVNGTINVLDWGIYYNGDNELDVGGKVNGWLGGINVNSGTLNVNGGTVSYGPENSDAFVEIDPPKGNVGGNVTVNAAIAVTPYVKDTSVTISRLATLDGDCRLGFMLREALSEYTEAGVKVNVNYAQKVVEDAVTFLDYENWKVDKSANAAGIVNVTLAGADE